MTPTLARMVAGKRREIPLPLRWFSIPNVFRYERPQKGRLREHYQLNVDLVGSDSREADLEIIGLASELLRTFGAKESDFIIRVNSRALLTHACEASGLTPEATRAYLRLLDKKSKMTPETFVASRTALSPRDPLAVIEHDAGSSSTIGNYVTQTKITIGWHLHQPAYYPTNFKFTQSPRHYQLEYH
jgi:histidyl-tRNA synthetase